MAGGGYGVRLDLRPLSALKPHEETIESSTREMVAQLRRDGVQKDPMIVDDETGVVLDGMHRLSAFRQLGVAFAVCDVVDYKASNITVGRWLRVYACQGESEAKAMLNELSLSRRSSIADARRGLDEGRILVAAFVGNDAFTGPGAGTIDDGFGTLKRADAFADSRGCKRSFDREEEFSMHAEDSSAVSLLIGHFGKKEVLDAGRTGRLFPCKTSMHLVDPRPVAVNMPVEELRTGSRESLDKRLQEGRFELLPPNSVYESRMYKERLLLLHGK